MERMKFFLIAILFVNMIFAGNGDEYDNKFQLGFTFGEIPILAGSFKPGLTMGYHFNKNLSIEFTIQLKDYLNRNEESFNAVNIGLEGLKSSKETTGERIFFGVRYRPADWSPYVSFGFVFNNDDVETIHFDKRQRIVGSGNYDSAVEIIQTRSSGIGPAIGFGYQYDFNENIGINTNFNMDFFSGTPSPKVKISSSEELKKEDKLYLENKILKSYKDNFHNNYHIFNLGVTYKFN